jgi:hypothetical protein
MSSAAAAADKRAGPAGTGRGGAIIRTQFAARLKQRSKNIFGRGIGNHEN